MHRRRGGLSCSGYFLVNAAEMCWERLKCSWRSLLATFFKLDTSEDRRMYFNMLERADWVLSTANHEFFGIAVVEAIMQGAFHGFQIVSVIPRSRLVVPM